MTEQPGMTPCPAGAGAHVDLGQAAVDVAAALEAARADEREKTAQRIVAHADKHAPKGDPATARHCVGTCSWPRGSPWGR